MTTSTTSGAKRPNKKEQGARRWLTIEYLLCIVSLLIVLTMTAWGAKSVVSTAIASERALAKKEAEKEKYVTYIYNAFEEKEEPEEVTADASAPAPSTLPQEMPKKDEKPTGGFDYALVDVEQFAGIDSYAGDLYAMREEYPKAEDILRRYEYAKVTVDGEDITVADVMDDPIPERLLKMAADYPQTMDYVLNYPSKIHVTFPIDVSDEVSGDEVPLFIQWDERWGYKTYGDGLLGYTGCGPTCLAMVASYLTKDASLTPNAVAEYADESGYYSYGVGSKWTLMTQAVSHYGLNYHNVKVSEWSLKNELDQGRPIICSVGQGDFTRRGHFIVLTGHEGSSFTVNDPNSNENSEKVWSYSTLSKQIRSAWSYSLQE